MRRLALLLLFGCGGTQKPPPPPPPPVVKTDGPAPIGVAACDRFIARYHACIPRFPVADQAAARDGLAKMHEAWRVHALDGPEARRELEEQCLAAIEQSRAALDDVCPATAP